LVPAVLATLFALLCGSAVAVAAAGGKPTLGSRLSGTKGFGHVKPPTVFLGGDPTGLVTELTWTSWGAPVAVALGSGFYTPPNKPTADSVKVPVTLDASDLGICKGHEAYRRMSFTFHYKGKAMKGSTVGICGKLSFSGG
jgi:hypothetical protein